MEQRKNHNSERDSGCPDCGSENGIVTHYVAVDGRLVPDFIECEDCGWQYVH